MLELIFTLVVVGVLLYLINAYVPMDGKIKMILNWAVVIIVVLWLLQSTGVLGHLNNVHVQ